MPRADLSCYGLSPREYEVACCIARGLEIKEIARELGVGYHTAKMHIRGAKRKMGVRNRLEVAILAHGGTPDCLQGTGAERLIEQAPAWSVGHRRRWR